MSFDHNLKQAVDLHSAGRLEEAAQAYRRVLEKDANNADAYCGLGTILMQSGQLEQAATLLNHAVELAPNAPEIAYNYALVLSKLGHIEPARGVYSRAVTQAVHEPELVVAICKKLLELGAAKLAYQHLAAVEPRSMEIDTLTAQARAAAGDWPGAVDELRELAQKGSQDATVLRDISKAAARIHDYETAKNAFNAYLSLIEPGPADHLAHADLLIVTKELDKAQEILLAHGDLDKANAEYMLAKIARFRNQPEKSRAHLNAAIEAKPVNADAWNLLIETEPEASLPDIAAKLRTLSEGNDGSDRDRFTLALAAGRVFDRIGKFPEAFECYRAGNSLHQKLLANAGTSYDAASVEQNFSGITARFQATAPRSAGLAAADQPIFIVGMPRSGTTLVEKILSCLDGVEIGGELVALEFVAAQYYRSVDASSSRPVGQMNAIERQRLVDSYWQWAGRQPGLITDKMPHNFRHIGLIANMFPASPVIYLRRDPRDVCLSIFARVFMDAHNYACDLESLGHFYAQSVRIMDYWKGLYPDRILEVVFEELVTDAEAKTREIAAFCGLRWDASCLEFEKKESSSFTFSEMQVRKPLNREGVGRWRNYEKELAPLCKILTDNKII